MNYKCIDSFTNLVEKRSLQSLAELHTLRLTLYGTKKKDKNMFVWKPVTILKLHLYLNLRMKSFTCWECVESLCSWITELQKISNEVF